MQKGQLTDAFAMQASVRQVCLLAPFLFFLEIDWIMKQSTLKKKLNTMDLPIATA